MRNFTICFTIWSESCQNVAVLEIRNLTICSESCQSVAVLVLTMRQQVREVHCFSQSPAAGCKHQQHNSSLLLSQFCHCFKPDCKQYIDSASSLAVGSTEKPIPFLQYYQSWAELQGDRAIQAYSTKNWRSLYFQFYKIGELSMAGCCVQTWQEDAIVPTSVLMCCISLKQEMR